MGESSILCCCGNWSRILNPRAELKQFPCAGRARAASTWKGIYCFFSCVSPDVLLSGAVYTPALCVVHCNITWKVSLLIWLSWRCAAGVSHMSRWGTVRPRRAASRSTSHFAHSGVHATSLFPRQMHGVLFSSSTVSVLGSSICTGNKETWKRNHWGCLAERKRINLLKGKDVIFFCSTFQFQPLYRFLIGFL